MIQVHDAITFATNYQVPWGMLMPLLGDIGASHVAPLFNYLSVARNVASAPALDPQGSDMKIEPISVQGPEPTNSVDWKSYELHAIDTGAELHVTVKYMPSAYETAAVRRFASTFLRCLQALADDPAAVVSDGPSYGSAASDGVALSCSNPASDCQA